AWVLDDPTHSFSLSNITCPQIMHPGETCTTDVRFTPHATGAVTATLGFPCQTVSLTCPWAQSITLHGTGYNQSAFLNSPVHFHFFGQTCTICRLSSQVIHVSNSSGSSITLNGAALDGQYAKDFAISSDSCGSAAGKGVQLAPKASCSLKLGFHPRTVGPIEALLNFHTSAGDYSQVVGGTAIGPSLLP